MERYGAMMVKPEWANLVDLLQSRAIAYPDRLAYKFLGDGEHSTQSLTYRELERKARAIASQLQHARAAFPLGNRAIGARVLLLYPPGLDFICAFFGCLAAGAIAVPVHLPRRQQRLQRLQGIVKDAGVKFVLTTAGVKASLEDDWLVNADLGALTWLLTDEIANDRSADWSLPLIGCDSLAFLQYTSGSTGNPKGVMVTHGNLLHNSELIKRAFRHDEGTIFVGWLPLFHDMGLIGNVLQPLYLGIPSILLSPVSFLQQPLRWLQAISDYRATTSGGPNFAYDLCVRKITAKQREQLDLSSWEVAFNGAEPVRAETLERFVDRFAECGLRREAMYPCYGLAEATLFVSGGVQGRYPILQHFNRVALAEHRAVAVDRAEGKLLVSCGTQGWGQSLLIVDPETFKPLAPDRVGEIWVRSESVAAGYWNRELDTKATFGARLADADNVDTYLRTGDLGFWHQGELFITGRLKDAIILRGRNHYPQDIEYTVEASHPALESGSSAAFSLEIAEEERLFVVAEVRRSAMKDLDRDRVMAAIAQAVSQEHELQIEGIALLKPHTIPKTSSGKIQRHVCRRGWEEGTLNTISISQKIASEPTNLVAPDRSFAVETEPSRSFNVPTPLDVEIQERVGSILRCSPSQIILDRPLVDLGIDSLQVVELKDYLETRFGLVLSVVAFLGDLTIQGIIETVAAKTSAIKGKSLGDEVLSLARQSSYESRVTSYDLEAIPKSQFPEHRSSDNTPTEQTTRTAEMEFSLFYFSSDAATPGGDKYKLLLEGAKFADREGFTAVWLPERHFHPFGGLYPNPAVLCAAIAPITERVRLRSGSVVLPLQDPIRVAEEWAVVDNLSAGRVDLAFARGWNPNDFVLAPDRYPHNTELLWSGIDTVRQLWRGNSISRVNGVGASTQIQIYPPPQQPDLNVWITCSGGEERLIEAGAAGYHVLTALLFQSVEELAAKIARYRQARADHGYDPDTGKVTLMLHTFIGTNLAEVKETVRQPFTEYLRSSIDLWRQQSIPLEELSERERNNDVLEYAFNRYFDRSALFGTPATCVAKIDRLRKAGVNEIACLIDFGVPVDTAIAGLSALKQLQESVNKPPASSASLGQVVGRGLWDVELKSAIDFRDDIFLDESIYPSNSWVKTTPTNIFLTGATGFLGAFLLRELLTTTNANIHCLVRNVSDAETAKQRLQANLTFYGLWSAEFTDRLLPILGDLSQPLFGLDRADFQSLAACIDIIYHCGALVNFIYPYHSLRAPNVLGTQEILCLACEIKLKPVHYISTHGVLNSTTHAGQLLTETDRIERPEGMVLGYTQSKWVAEGLCHLGRDRGIPISIYRLAWLLGDSQTGVTTPNTFLSRIIAGCLQMKTAPNLDYPWQIVPTDYASRAIAYLSQQDDCINRDFHIINSRPLPWMELIDKIVGLGHQIDTIDPETWLIQLKQTMRSLADPLFPLLPLFLETTDRYGNSIMQIHQSHLLPQLSGSNTHQILVNGGIELPSIDDKLIAFYLNCLGCKSTHHQLGRN